MYSSCARFSVLRLSSVQKSRRSRVFPRRSATKKCVFRSFHNLCTLLVFKNIICLVIPFFWLKYVSCHERGFLACCVCTGLISVGSGFLLTFRRKSIDLIICLTPPRAALICRKLRWNLGLPPACPPDRCALRLRSVSSNNSYNK